MLYGRNNALAIDLKKNLAGRFGVVFDPINDGKTKLFAHYGRFYESIPMDINIRSFGGETLLLLLQSVAESRRHLSGGRRPR